MRSTSIDTYAMPKRRKGEIPLIIKQGQKAIDDDVKPTLHVLGKLFFGAWPKPEPAPRERQGSTERRPALPIHHVHEPSRSACPPRIVVREVTPSSPSSSSSQKPSSQKIVDAEILEEVIERPRCGQEVIDGKHFSRNCPTCGGSGKVGMQGHEVSCPSCSRT